MDTIIEALSVFLDHIEPRDIIVFMTLGVVLSVIDLLKSVAKAVLDGKRHRGGSDPAK